MRIHHVARVAGVTTRAVRHYHRIGALPEPEREPNGYRRYSMDDLARLIRLRSLIEAGVPLRGIKTMPGQEITRQDRVELLASLKRRRAELDECIKSLEALQTAPSTLHADAVGALLEMADALELSSSVVSMERDALDLLAARDTHSPALRILTSAYRAMAEDPALGTEVASITADLNGLDSIPNNEFDAKSTELAHQIADGLPRALRRAIAEAADPNAEQDQAWLTVLVPHPRMRTVLAKVIHRIRGSQP